MPSRPMAAVPSPHTPGTGVPHDEHLPSRNRYDVTRKPVRPNIRGTAEAVRNSIKKHAKDPWSLLFDLKILFLTLFVGFVNRKAY